ncbi:MAG: DNA phosphorothioation system sulfurtransferase DndC [Planctomycetes bacterium]|nr:DNA phosphorothioation system sulfurtransferase DndC [Planctomycetota bacterium]
MLNSETKKRLVIQDIKEKYINISRPWVIGYSGGKDSTCVLELVWQALSELRDDERKDKIFVVTSDTMVESPLVSEYISDMMFLLDKAANEQKLPISVHCVKPETKDTFWVNLIGRGYPAPRTKFRWCTDRLKIEPANRLILDLVSRFGEAVVVLGVRKSESSARAQVIRRRQSNANIAAGAELPRHSTLPGAYVYAPISDWSTDEVWEYLLLNAATPWNSNNRDLAAMYKEASDGECPLVIDNSTASCGNSRFGCWVCTVVEKNKSLENIADKGREWLEPLIRYRNMLMDTTEPSNKAKYREYKRRSGNVSIAKNDLTGETKIIRGPYYFHWRKHFLNELLKAEREIINKTNKEYSLITPQELKEIRKLWITEEGDWEDSVPLIYRGVFGHDLPWDIDDSSRFGAADMELLQRICSEINISPELVSRLIDKEREFSAAGRRSSLNKELDIILREEWRTEQEILENESILK